ncbi:hydroxymethylglutaryl-CoA lyase [Deferrisoma sp.]
MIEKISPWYTLNPTPMRAFTPPKLRWMSSTSSCTGRSPIAPPYPPCGRFPGSACITSFGFVSQTKNAPNVKCPPLPLRPPAGAGPRIPTRPMAFAKPPPQKGPFVGAPGPSVVSHSSRGAGHGGSPGVERETMLTQAERTRYTTVPMETTPRSPPSLRELARRAPKAVILVDVSARDGLQSLPVRLSASARAHWIKRVLESGVPEVEAGSFVHPGKVPQMAGTDEVLARLRGFEPRLWVLVPNAKGLERAVAAGAQNAIFLASATEAHSRANLGRPVAEVLRDLEPMTETARAHGVRVRLAVSMAWTDPVEGPVPEARLLELCARAHDLGIHEITLCDTQGGASPLAVAQRVEAVSRVVPLEALGVHLHDPFGTAGAAAWAAWLCGVRRFDGSLGGLGGCPVLETPEGNQDLLELEVLFRGLGVETGVDRERLQAAARFHRDLLARAEPLRR